jgi:hypothetical protein
LEIENRQLEFPLPLLGWLVRLAGIMNALLPALLLVLFLTGCLRYHRHLSASTSSTTSSRLAAGGESATHLPFEYYSRGGKAALKSDRLVLVFHDLTDGQRQTFHFPDSGHSLQISGAGHQSVSTSCRHNLTFVKFQASYQDGTNTIEFGGQTVRGTSCADRVTARSY